jgi:hypothetical protein
MPELNRLLITTLHSAERRTFSSETKCFQIRTVALAGRVPRRRSVGYDVEVVFSNAVSIILNQTGPFVTVDGDLYAVRIRIKGVLDQF